MIGRRDMARDARAAGRGAIDQDVRRSARRAARGVTALNVRLGKADTGPEKLKVNSSHDKRDHFWRVRARGVSPTGLTHTHTHTELKTH